MLDERLLCGFCFGCPTAVFFPVPHTGIGMRSGLLVHLKHSQVQTEKSPGSLLPRG